jgi:hypothetical protein
MRRSQATPVHERQPKGTGCGFDVPPQNVLVVMGHAGLDALKYQIVGAGWLNQIVFSDRSSRPNFYRKCFQTMDAVNHFWWDANGRGAGVGFWIRPVTTAISFLDRDAVGVNGPLLNPAQLQETPVTISRHCEPLRQLGIGVGRVMYGSGGTEP